MAQNKAGIPKGTRDFSPEVMVKRNYIFHTIRSIYELHGFMPIETPAMENLSTLLGKYGEEGDKLLFKVLNSGDFIGRAKLDKSFNQYRSNEIVGALSEKGLRYDLTVPFARYVVQHQNEIQFPFKRYQIQPVWRADRPQRGRYREFYQCDADIIGSNALLNELELIQIIDEVFAALDIPTVIRINNRKILAGIADYIGYPDRMIDVTIAIDKLLKIGVEGVNKELLEKGINQDGIDKLQPVFNLKGSVSDRIEKLSTMIAGSEIGKVGIEEVNQLLKLVSQIQLTSTLELDLTLARGLNYYTGAIIEVEPVMENRFGSICGGGRYDDLTGIFGLKNMSGVGVSFGADRIFDVMETLNLFPDSVSPAPKVLFVNFGSDSLDYILPIATELRRSKISCDIYPDSAKIQKQFKNADKRGIQFVAIAGESEVAGNSITIKDLIKGEQEVVPVGKLVQYLTEKIQ